MRSTCLTRVQISEAALLTMATLKDEFGDYPKVELKIKGSRSSINRIYEQLKDEIAAAVLNESIQSRQPIAERSDFESDGPEKFIRVLYEELVVHGSTENFKEESRILIDEVKDRYEGGDVESWNDVVDIACELQEDGRFQYDAGSERNRASQIERRILGSESDR